MVFKTSGLLPWEIVSYSPLGALNYFLMQIFQYIRIYFHFHPFAIQIISLPYLCTAMCWQRKRWKHFPQENVSTVHEWIVQTTKHWMGCYWSKRFHNVSGQSVPVIYHPHSTELIPDVQAESSVFQFVPTPSCSGTGHCWRELGFIIFPPCLQLIMVWDSPGPFPHQAEQSQLSQPFLTGDVFQLLYDPPSQSLAISSMFTSVLYWWARTACRTPVVASWMLSTEDHLLWPAGNTFPNEDRNTIYLLSMCILLTCGQLGVLQDPLVLFWLLSDCFSIFINDIQNQNDFELSFSNCTQFSNQFNLLHKAVLSFTLERRKFRPGFWKTVLLSWWSKISQRER